jgi:mersacidin/lichenicidin family type 2 lantibiotic
MSHANIIRAWKDADFRNSLSEKERTLLPENPAGLIELTDAQLGVIAGGLRYATERVMCTLDSCN